MSSIAVPDCFLHFPERINLIVHADSVIQHILNEATKIKLENIFIATQVLLFNSYNKQFIKILGHKSNNIEQRRDSHILQMTRKIISQLKRFRIFHLQTQYPKTLKYSLSCCRCRAARQFSVFTCHETLMLKAE